MGPKFSVCIGAGFGYFIGWLTPNLDVTHGAIYGGLIGAALFLIAAISVDALGLTLGLMLTAGLILGIALMPFSVVLGGIALGLVVGIALTGRIVFHDKPLLPARSTDAPEPTREEREREERAAWSARLEKLDWAHATAAARYPGDEERQERCVAALLG